MSVGLEVRGENGLLQIDPDHPNLYLVKVVTVRTLETSVHWKDLSGRTYTDNVVVAARWIYSQLAPADGTIGYFFMQYGRRLPTSGDASTLTVDIYQPSGLSGMTSAHSGGWLFFIYDVLTEEDERYNYGVEVMDEQGNLVFTTTPKRPPMRVVDFMGGPIPLGTVSGTTVTYPNPPALDKVLPVGEYAIVPVTEGRHVVGSTSTKKWMQGVTGWKIFKNRASIKLGYKQHTATTTFNYGGTNNYAAALIVDVTDDLQHIGQVVDISQLTYSRTGTAASFNGQGNLTTYGPNVPVPFFEDGSISEHLSLVNSPQAGLLDKSDGALADYAISTTVGVNRVAGSAGFTNFISITGLGIGPPAPRQALRNYPASKDSFVAHIVFKSPSSAGQNFPSINGLTTSAGNTHMFFSYTGSGAHIVYRRSLNKAQRLWYMVVRWNNTTTSGTGGVGFTYAPETPDVLEFQIAQITKGPNWCALFPWSGGTKGSIGAGQYKSSSIAVREIVSKPFVIETRFMPLADGVGGLYNIYGPTTALATNSITAGMTTGVTAGTATMTFSSRIGSNVNWITLRENIPYGEFTWLRIDFDYTQSEVVIDGDAGTPLTGTDQLTGIDRRYITVGGGNVSNTYMDGVIHDFMLMSK